MGFHGISCARCHGALKIAATPAALGAPEAHREKVADAVSSRGYGYGYGSDGYHMDCDCGDTFIACMMCLFL